jgi:hypothetical protein
MLSIESTSVDSVPKGSRQKFARRQSADAAQQRMLLHQLLGYTVDAPASYTIDYAQRCLQGLLQLVLKQSLPDSGIDLGSLREELHPIACKDVLAGFNLAGR